MAAVCIGLSKTGFGGVGMLAVLLMAQVMPARESTGAVLPLLIVADVFAVHAFRRFAGARIHDVRVVVPVELHEAFIVAGRCHRFAVG